MDPTPATAPAAEGDKDEWELQNDDGFVYKCRKRRRWPGDNSAAPDTAIAVVDPEAEEKNRREKQRRILVKLMKRYRREMDLWEVLSNGLQDMREKAVRLPEQRLDAKREDETASFLVSASVLVREAKKDASGGGVLLDELFLLADTEEEVIQKVSSWFDIAEAVCNAETERLKQSWFDLPIWGSPCELMASLCFE